MTTREHEPERGQQDTDMLCDDELIERGYEPRFTKLTEKTEPTPEPEAKCHFCGRKMKAPVTKFEKYGIDFVPDNEKAHEGCARRQFEQIKDVLKATSNN